VHARGPCPSVGSRDDERERNGDALKYMFDLWQEKVLTSVGVVPNSLQDIGRASDGAKRRPVKAEGWAGA
jgi:hypothetical protein